MEHLDIYRATDNLPYEKVGDEVHCLSELAPFEIPETWEWCRVGDLFYNTSGLSYKKDLLAKKSDSMVRVLRGGNIGDETYFFKEDDVFISSKYVKPELFLKKNYMITPAVSSIEHIGKLALIEQDYADVVVGGFVLMLMPYFSDDIISQYLLYAFAAKNHRDNCRNITHKSGQAFYNLSREKLMNLPVPLPPHNEMIRIIQKLKTVLPIAMEYSNKEQDVNKLNTTFPDILKKSILQEAVQGKLVPQDPADEPAFILLERIREEKQKLIAEGKIKRDKHESFIFRRDNSHYEKLNGIELCVDDEIPFEIPESWEWVRLKNLVKKEIKRGKSPKYAVSSNIQVFAQKCNVKAGGIDMTLAKYLDNTVFPKYPEEEYMRDSDIVVNSTGNGTLGRIGMFHDSDRINKNIIVPDSHVTVIRTSKFLLADYIFYVLNYYQPYLEKSCSGSTNQTELKPAVISELFIPVPPINEQRRIVNKLSKTIKLLTE